MTEAEAKTKWCPMRRAESSGFDKVFGPMPDTSNARCIASACMMWRQFETNAPRVEIVGYCGLARS